MVVNPGDKIHVIIRRTFEEDLRRHFVGEVMEADHNVVKVEGYAIVYDSSKNRYEKKSHRRQRIVSLVDSNNLINFLPDDVDVDTLVYIHKDGKFYFTDDKTFWLDINEFGVNW